MNRKQFFKKLGVGAAVCIAAPEVLRAMPKNEDKRLFLKIGDEVITEAEPSVLEYEPTTTRMSPDDKDELSSIPLRDNAVLYKDGVIVANLTEFRAWMSRSHPGSDALREAFFEGKANKEFFKKSPLNPCQLVCFDEIGNAYTGDVVINSFRVHKGLAGISIELQMGLSGALRQE